MQVETTAHLACPLCKRQFLDSSEHTPNTRLCQACQAMVLTACRGPNSGFTHAAGAVHQSTPALAIQSDEQFSDQGLVNAPTLFELMPADALESEPQAGPPLPFDAPDPTRFDFYQEEDPGYETGSLSADSPDFVDAEESQAQMQFLDGSVESLAITEQSYMVADEPRLIEQPSSISESTVESTFDAGEPVKDRLEYQPPTVEQVVPDEGQTAVATWEADCDTSSEWPLLVVPSSERSFRKPRLAFAALAATVILAVAGGFYFFVNSPDDSQERRVDAGTMTNGLAVEPQAASVGSAVTASLAPVVQSPAENAAAPPRPAEGQTTDGSARGKFSLQAASFPTQEGAEEFAERLKRAGVASYVVPAELIRRGRWFRVRVGRFSTAEEAQKFVGEAQQRARAAGIALQLIVCQYGQP